MEMKTTVTSKEANTQCPITCIPQQCGRTCISLHEISDSDILAELKRRGYKGELKIYKTVYV